MITRLTEENNIQLDIPFKGKQSYNFLKKVLKHSNPFRVELQSPGATAKLESVILKYYSNDIAVYCKKDSDAWIEIKTPKIQSISMHYHKEPDLINSYYTLYIDLLKECRIVINGDKPSAELAQYLTNFISKNIKQDTSLV